MKIKWEGDDDDRRKIYRERGRDVDRNCTGMWRRNVIFGGRVILIKEVPHKSGVGLVS
jgi:hypothetical protein